MFDCKGCKSKDGEIGFLRQQVTDLQSRLMILSGPEAAALYSGLNGSPVDMKQTYTDPESGERVEYEENPIRDILEQAEVAHERFRDDEIKALEERSERIWGEDVSASS